MERVEKYRHLAADCFAAAQHMADSHLKATMLAMASSWSALAARAEQRSKFGLGDRMPMLADDQIR